MILSLVQSDVIVETTPSSDCGIKGPLELIVAKVVGEYSQRVDHQPDGDLRFKLQTPARQYRAQLIVHEHERLLRLYVFPDSIFFTTQSNRVAELVGRVSSKLVFGSLEWNADEQFAAFRNAVIAQSDVEASQIASMLESCVFALELWSRSFELVIEYNLSPNDACNLALVNAGVAGPRNLSTAAMKQLLTLHR